MCYKLCGYLLAHSFSLVNMYLMGFQVDDATDLLLLSLFREGSLRISSTLLRSACLQLKWIKVTSFSLSYSILKLLLTSLYHSLKISLCELWLKICANGDILESIRFHWAVWVQYVPICYRATKAKLFSCPLFNSIMFLNLYPNCRRLLVYLLWTVCVVC